MKLQRREKILAALALGLVGLAGLWFLLFAGDSRSGDQLIADQTKLTSEIEDKQKQRQAAGRDAKRLAQWQRRALPPEPSLARSLYRNWLSNLAASVNLRKATLVASPDAGTHRDQYTRIAFTLSAQAKLGDLVEFLYKFYSAGFLHQIRKMDIKPNKGSRELDVNLTIEALSLPTAESKKKLPEKTDYVLRLAKLSDYRPIVSRDFFTAYVPPIPPSAPRHDSSVDPADHAVVTAFVEVDGAAQVWIQDRMGDKSWKLGTGQGFAVGNTKGTVEFIRPEGEVVVEFDGRRRVLHVGDNLHGGVEIQGKQPDPDN